MSDRVIGKVYESTDYKKFKLRNANRDIDDKHVRDLIRSIEAQGLRTPIEVNDQMEIQDGQHRFEALRALRRPVQYIITGDRTIAELADQNTSCKKWRNKDHIHARVMDGNVSYRYLANLIEQFPGISLECICLPFGKDVNSAQIQSGEFTCTSSEYEKAQRALNYIMSCSPSVCISLKPKNGNMPKVYVRALLFCQRIDGIDNEVLLKQLNRYAVLLQPATTTEIAVECIDAVYNYKNRNKVDIKALYRKEKAERVGRNFAEARKKAGRNA